MPLTVQHVKTSLIADDAADARRFLSYDPHTGEIRWKEKRTRNSKANVGDLAGGLDDHGYVRVMLNGRKYRAQHLAFALMGDVVPLCVDHINGIRNDNRWCNLRPASIALNNKNAVRKRTGSTPHKGVTWSKAHNKWKCRINNDGVTEYLGLFADLDVAVTAWQTRAEQLKYSARHRGVSHVD